MVIEQVHGAMMPSLTEAVLLAFELDRRPRIEKGQTSDTAKLVLATLAPKQKLAIRARLNTTRWAFDHHISERGLADEFHIVVSL